MALTQSMLKAMGIEDEKREQILDAHHAIADQLKDERDALKEKLAESAELEREFARLQGQLEEAKASVPSDFEAKYEELKAEFEDYRSRVDAEKAEAERASLYRALLREAGVDERRIESVMRVTDLSGVSVEDGAIKDSESLKESIGREWADFIVRESTVGAKPDEPPATTPAKMTRDEIMDIRDTQARQQAIAENIDQFQ